MLNYKIVRFSGLCVITGVVLFGCQKIVQGFLSPNIFYVENPLQTTQGQLTLSSSLEIDGSTTPIHAELTKVADSTGKDVTAVMSKVDSVTGYAGTVTYLDSTLALLDKKIVTTAAIPLSVNPIGGRIQLTPATKYVPAGTYTIDIKVSNVRASRSIPSACQIIIDSAGATASADTLYPGFYTATCDSATGRYKYGLAAPVINITYSPTTINKIVYKFIDKNGNVYDPKTGGIGSRAYHWYMKNFDPYYPEVLTDTSAEYQIPVVPSQFPVFANPGAAIGVVANGNFGCYTAIPKAHNNTGYQVYVYLDMAFFKQGTFIITTTFPDVLWQ